MDCHEHAVCMIRLYWVQDMSRQYEMLVAAAAVGVGCCFGAPVTGNRLYQHNCGAHDL